MRCPGCTQNVVTLGSRLRVAMRVQTRCPACGVAIRFGFWPRLVHSLFGDAMLLGGIAGALFWQAPFLMPLAAGSWLTLALLLPVEPGPKSATTRTATG